MSLRCGHYMKSIILNSQAMSWPLPHIVLSLGYSKSSVIRLKCIDYRLAETCAIVVLVLKSLNAAINDM